MRPINEIIIHCTDTPITMDIGAAKIDEWHKEKGWDCVGYHFVVKLNGEIEPGRAIDKVGAHCKWHNKYTIGICYVGGRVVSNGKVSFQDTRTPEQIRSLYLLVKFLLHCYPSITKVSGHNDYSLKKCPCFDVHAEFDQIVERYRANMARYS